jgi:hypothetical protein
LNTDAVITDVDPYATFTTLALRERGNDGASRALDGVELEEGTRLVADDLEVLDGSEAGREMGRESSLAYRLRDVLDEATGSVDL